MEPYRKTQDKTFSQHPITTSTPACNFALKDPHLQIGRVCQLDHMYCSNFSDLKLIERCPTLLAHLRGEPVGQTPNLDFPGVPHVIESGPTADHVRGMPTEFMPGRMKKGSS
jgi:hypothetical protein